MIALVLGLENLLIDGLYGPLSALFGYLGLAFSLVIGVDLAVALLVLLIEGLLTRVKQVELIYEQRGGDPG